MYQVKFKDVIEFRSIEKPGHPGEREVIIAIKGSIENLINMPIRDAQLNYDVTSKFKKAVEALGKEFDEHRKALLEKHTVKSDEDNAVPEFDIPIGAIYDELFNIEVELNCYKLKRSRFQKENLAWEVKGETYAISLGDLEMFIDNDIPE